MRIKLETLDYLLTYFSKFDFKSCEIEISEITLFSDYNWNLVSFLKSENWGEEHTYNFYLFVKNIKGIRTCILIDKI
jgi:hypothetical protein